MRGGGQLLLLTAGDRAGGLGIPGDHSVLRHRTVTMLLVASFVIALGE